MSKFAKVYETDEGDQVLVTLGVEDDKPYVRFTTVVNGNEVAMTHHFEDPDQDLCMKKCRKAFDTVTEDVALSARLTIVGQLDDIFNPKTKKEMH